MNKETIECKAYQRYKLLWLAQHDFNLSQVFNEICSYNADYINENDCEKVNDALVWFDNWERECGFDSQIYPCFEEFLENEFQDEDLRTKLLTDEELRFLGPNSRYIIRAYDKDNDVYEDIISFSKLSDAIARLGSIIGQHKEAELRRIDNNEPYDWFDIMDSESNQIAAVASLEREPNGNLTAKIAIY